MAITSGSTYGVTRYSQGLYGLSRPATVVPGGTSLPLINDAYLIDPFVASPVNYTSVLLTWNGPDTGTATPMTEYRLLSSRYGFPVDENDGNILFDTTTAPGNQYVDQNVVPGQMTYYGFYINTGTSWVRAGFTACLMPVSHGYGTMLFNLLPEYLRDIGNGELTASDPTGNPYLIQWLDVAGWALDYLQTQYDFLYNYQNDPMHVSFSDLAQLAAELGMPFSGEIPAYYLRMAADNWSTVMRQRGSLAGIEEHISLLSGFGVDLQLSRNIMLENDQSSPVDPRPEPWSAGLSYNPGEMVLWPVYPEWVASQSYVVDNYVVYNGVNYSCTATGGQGIPPSGAADSSTYWTEAAGPYFYVCISAASFGDSPPAAPDAGDTPDPNNTWWQLVYDYDSMPPYQATQEYAQGNFVLYEGNLFVCIAPSVTGTAPPTTATSSTDWSYVSSPTTDYIGISGLSGGESTWEVLYATEGSTTPDSTQPGTGTLLEGIALRNPSNWSNDYSQNSFRVTNVGSSTADQWLRSVSRDATDIASGATVPDPQLVVEHGIPVPQVIPQDEWNDTTRYDTGTVVSYHGLNYLALRASTGATPPLPGVPLNENYDFETGITPWVTWGGATASQSSAEAYQGTYSMLLSIPASSSYPGVGAEYVTVIPNATYNMSAWLYSTEAVSISAGISWYDAWDYRIDGSSYYFADGVAIPANTWTQITAQCVAPPNASTASANWILNGTSPSTATSVYTDMAMFTCSATPEWLPLGLDSRMPLVISAQTIQDYSVDASETFPIYPFVEFYDNWGNLITRAFARQISTPADGTFESGVGDWAPTNATVTQTSAAAYTGTYSAEVAVVTAGTEMYLMPRPSFMAPVIPGETYTASMFMRMTSSVSMLPAIWWYTSDLTYISASSGTAVTPATYTWVQESVTGTAPATAAYAGYGPAVTDPPAGTYFYVDNITLSGGPSEGTPSTYTYDSFMTGANTPINGRLTDTADQNWTVGYGAGQWLLDGNGNAYASGITSAFVTAPLSCTQAVTFTEDPTSGLDTGLLFWYDIDASSWWHAGMTELYYADSSTGSTLTSAATYTKAFSAGDRIYVVTDQATPQVTVYRNLIQDYDSTTGNGQVAQVTPASGAVPSSGTTVYSGLVVEDV